MTFRSRYPGLSEYSKFNRKNVRVFLVYDGAGSVVVADDTWMEVQGKESIVNMGREQPIANKALLQLNMYLSL